MRLMLSARSNSPHDSEAVGSSPNALAVSPDGYTLYVANAGNNDVAVIHIFVPDANRLASRSGPLDTVVGHIPTGWYPTALALSPDGNTLYVANAKGLGAGPNGHIKGKTYIAALMRALCLLSRARTPRSLPVIVSKLQRVIECRNRLWECWRTMASSPCL